MAHRTILTARQRATLFDLPTDEANILYHYTLSDDDLEQAVLMAWMPSGGGIHAINKADRDDKISGIFYYRI